MRGVPRGCAPVAARHGNGTQGPRYWRLVNLWWCSVNEAPQHLAVNACNEGERERENETRDDARRKPETPLNGIIRTDAVNWRWRHRTEPIRQFVYWPRVGGFLAVSLIETSSIEADTGTRRIALGFRRSTSLRHREIEREKEGENICWLF